MLHIIALFILTSCVNNPSHKPTIGGSIKILDNKNTGICFLPKFETSYLTSTTNYNDLRFINLSYIAVTLGDDPISNKTVWKANPVSTNFYKVKDGDSICINQTTPELRSVKYDKLDNGSYTVVIAGMDDKQRYNLRFVERFKYTKNSN